MAATSVRLWSPKHVLQSILDKQPLTALGALVLGFGGLCVLFAGRTLDLVFTLVGWSVIALAVLAVLAVGFFALVVARRCTTGHVATDVRLEAGSEAGLPFLVPSAFWLPIVDIAWSWASHPEVVCNRKRVRWGVFRETVIFPGRGVYRGVVRKIVVRDVLGLAQVALRMSDSNEYKVLPAKGALGSQPMHLASIGGDQTHHPLGARAGDRIDLRRYAPGDPARFIHWKIFGRTRKLVVRIPERAWMENDRKLIFFVAGEQDESSAGILRAGLERDIFGEDWAFAASGNESLVSTRDEALRVLIRSRASREVGASKMSSAISMAEKEGPVSVVAFVPPVPGDWMRNLDAIIRRRRGSVHVVCGIDEIKAEPKKRWWKRLLLRETSTAGVSRALVDGVSSTLSRAGASTVVLNRTDGRLILETRSSQ